MKRKHSSLFIVACFLIAGCAVDNSGNQEFQTQLSVLQLEISQLSTKLNESETSITQKDQGITNLREQLDACRNEDVDCESKVKSVYSCESDDDCVLVIAGRCWCEDCKQHTLDDPEVIAVNKNLYKCPPAPEGLMCAACVGSINYDPSEDAVCRMGKCEKR